MANKGIKNSQKYEMGKKAMRNFPRHPLQDALIVAQKIQDEKAGKPFKRLLLADALGLKPSSSNFRDILSSSYKYGLTEGTEKAPDISLTSNGANATQTKDSQRRSAALRSATLTPSVFMEFYTAYKDSKLPSEEMMKKLLVSEYAVPAEYAEECAKLVIQNGRFVAFIRDIGGSPHVIMDDVELSTTQPDNQPKLESGEEKKEESPTVALPPKVLEEQKTLRAIFLAHGKKHAPAEKLQKILSSFQIPYKVVVAEPNLGRPISKKVKETMLQCGSAILIFTCDEKFCNDNGEVVWRPSENVVYELGAASYAYEDRVVIFKEKGLHFPTNFSGVGYIEFEEDSLEVKTTDLLKELIGFGLVKITTA